MLQYCQAFFICLAQESNPGKLRAASRSVPPQRNYAAALWDPKPATSQQQSHMPPTRFLLLLHHPLSPLPLRQVSCNTPRRAGGAFKTSPKRSDKKKIIKKYVQAAKYTWKYYANKCGTTEQLPTVLPHSRNFPPASSHSLRPSLRKKRRKSSLCLPTRPPPLAVASCAQFSAFPFLFLSNEKLLSIKYLLSRRILWHKSRLTVLLAQNVACFSLCFPAIRWPSEIFGA